MGTVWLASFGSVITVSAISLLGILVIPIRERKLNYILLYLVSFAVGAMLGDVFLHLLPEAVEEARGFSLSISFYALLGIAASFVMEKILHWRHFHAPESSRRHSPLAVMNLVGDGVHNFIDGLIIATSYIVSIPVGIASTIAVILHEIPQEIGDFGVLLHSGFSKKQALTFNFITALTALVGAFIAFVLSYRSKTLTMFFIPFAAGNFIYIAGSDLIPELHKEVGLKKIILQFFSFMIGIGIMYLLTYVQ